MTNLLVLGGNAFLGRAVAVEAVARGHAVTTFTRGRTGSAPPGVDAVRGSRDRPDDLAAAVADRRVDAVVDTSCLKPGWAAAALDALPGVRSYVLVSTACVYRDYPPGPVMDESAPVYPAGGRVYGSMKVGNEDALRERIGDRALAVRAGVLVGPGDVLGALPWWLWRLRAGGPVPVPAHADVPISLLDVRDLASWLVTAAERGTGGTANVTGDLGACTLAGLIDLCAAAVAPDAVAPVHPVPVGDDELAAAGVTVENLRMPFWAPRGVAETVWPIGSTVAGPACRPVADTVRDTWAWLRELPAVPLKAGVPAPGLSPADESALLAGAGVLQSGALQSGALQSGVLR